MEAYVPDRILHNFQTMARVYLERLNPRCTMEMVILDAILNYDVHLPRVSSQRRRAHFFVVSALDIIEGEGNVNMAGEDWQRAMRQWIIDWKERHI